MSVLVTVVGPRTSADLELDDTCPVSDLLAELAAALGELSLPRGLRTADGKDLAAEASLADAGVLDGHRVTLLAVDDPSRSAVLSCYLAIDTSDSMAGSALEAVNVEIARFVDAIRADSRLAQVCRLAVVTFDADARVHQPLTSVTDLQRVPWLAATRPATNYEVVLRLLREQISEDAAALRRAGRRRLRPAVFLITDGHSTRGTWAPAHAALTDTSWSDAPDVVAFGFGEAAGRAIRRLGTAGAYLPAPVSGRPPRAPVGMVPTLMTFLVDRLGGAAEAAPAIRQSLEEVSR